MALTSSITMPSMVGIVGRAPAVDEKVFFLFVFCWFVTLWNFEVCGNGNCFFGPPNVITLQYTLNACCATPSFGGKVDWKLPCCPSISPTILWSNRFERRLNANSIRSDSKIVLWLARMQISLFSLTRVSEKSELRLNGRGVIIKPPLATARAA